MVLPSRSRRGPENGQCHGYCGVGLFSLERRNSVAHMLAAEAHGVAATQPGIEQHIEPHALPRADRPSALVSGDIIFGPRAEAWPFLRGGFFTPAVGSALAILASTAHRKSPRMASRKLRAWAGVVARRSRPATMMAAVIFANDCSPAVSITCRKMFSRCRRLPSRAPSSTRRNLDSARSASSMCLRAVPWLCVAFR